MKLIGAKCSLRVIQITIIALKALSLKLKISAFDKGQKHSQKQFSLKLW